MTAKQIYEHLSSQISVSFTDDKALRGKYGDEYKNLLKKAERFDYVNTVLATPILSAMPQAERNVFNRTLIKTVPMFTINAYSVKADNGEYLVVLNERLLALISSYHQIRFSAVNNILNGNGNEEFARNFLPVVNCYLAPEAGNILPIYGQDEVDRRSEMMTYLLCIANEQFILAHELAHIFLNHLDGVHSLDGFAIKNFMYATDNTEQDKEFAADVQAVKWLHNMIRSGNCKLPLSMYIEVFVLLHLIECNCGFPDNNSSHPSALNRLINIKDSCSDRFDARDSEFIDDMIKHCRDINSFVI